MTGKLGAFSASAAAAELDRRHELATLHTMTLNSKANLVFGPAGVGKTHILRSFTNASFEIVYTDQTQTARNLLFSIWQTLASRKIIKQRTDAVGLSVVSLKGIVQSALESNACTLVLDQLNNPSRPLTRLIHDLHFFGRTPLILAARSYHMEDVGGLHALCARTSERLEVRPWSREASLLLAQQLAAQQGLRANDLNTVLNEIVRYAAGNPRALHSMVRMAGQSEYRTGSQVKTHVLYVDYCMGKTMSGERRSA